MRTSQLASESLDMRPPRPRGKRLPGATIDQDQGSCARERLAHVPAKWIPVRRQDHAPSKNLQPFPIL
jgi:hypothetical protein